MLYAIDVSHHQNPSYLDWAGMRSKGCDACIVRLTYGTRIDEKAAEHIRLARAAGFVVGAYAFARTTEPILAQYAAFEKAAELAEYGRPEDVVPALDIEDDTASRPILPAHAPLFEDFARRLGAWRGEPPYCYVTQRDWGRLGRPAWVLDYPLFVAHYAPPTRAEPATPNGMLWSIWQHRVGVFDLHGPSGYYPSGHDIDQSRVRSLRFLNGETFDSNELKDMELRKHPDPDDATPLIREARLASFLRAEATQAAEDSRFANLESLRASVRATLDTLDDEPDSDPEHIA